MDDQLIPLTDVVAALRAEIETAVAAAPGAGTKFNLGPIDLEFQTVVTREGKLGGKISFKVLGVGAELGADGTLTNAHTQKVKFVLNPVKVTATGEAPVQIHRVPGQPPATGPG
jgi:hypothetical protein